MTPTEHTLTAPALVDHLGLTERRHATGGGNGSGGDGGSGGDDDGGRSGVERLIGVVHASRCRLALPVTPHCGTLGYHAGALLTLVATQYVMQSMAAEASNVWMYVQGCLCDALMLG